MASRSISAVFNDYKDLAHKDSLVFSSSLSADAPVYGKTCVGGSITFSRFRGYAKSYYFIIYINGVEACETNEIVDQDSSTHQLVTYIDTNANIDSNALLNGSGSIEIVARNNNGTGNVCGIRSGCQITIEASYTDSSGGDSGGGDTSTAPPYPPASVTVSATETYDDIIVLRWSESQAGSSNNPVSDYGVKYRDSADGKSFGDDFDGTYIDSTTNLYAYVGTPSPGMYRKYTVVAYGQNGGNSYNRDSTGGHSPTVHRLVSTTECKPPEVVELSSSQAASKEPVTLSWRNAEAGVNNSIVGYEIWKASTSDGTYNYVNSVSTTNTFGETTVFAPETNGNTEYYKVKTIGSETGYSSELSDVYVSLTCSYSLPGIPQNVNIDGKTTVYAESGSVRLEWDAASDGVNNVVTGYSIYRDGVYYTRTTDTFVNVPVNDVAGSYHSYTVYTLGEYADSSASSEVLVYTYSAVEAPNSVLVNGEDAIYVDENIQVLLAWSGANSGAYNDIVGYQVYQDGKPYRVTTETSLSVPSNTSGGEHAYAVMTLGERGNSELSSSAMVYSYAAVFAPSSVSISNESPDASDPVTIHFSGAAAGSFNPIRGYKIYEDIGATGSYKEIATIESVETSGSYDIYAVDEMAVTCRYKVSTIGEYGESKLSTDYAEYTTKSYGACTPPNSVIIDKNSAGPNDIANLYWSGAQNGENSSIVKYAVYRSDRSDRDYEWLFETNETFAEISASETEGQTYYFKVQSIADNVQYNSKLSDAYAWIRTSVTTEFGGNSVPASASFHAAIKNRAKQRALIYFFSDGLWLTNDDIVSDGIKYENNFCSEEDMTVGLTPSATISFSVFNDHHRLDGMRFGKFRARIGAMTKTDVFEPFGNVTAIYDGDAISGHDQYPYVRVNKVGLNDQPDFAVKSIFVMNDRIYCIGDGEKFVVYARNIDAQRNDVKQYIWQQVYSMTWAELRSIVWGEDTRFNRDEKGYINALMLAVSERYANRRIGIVVESDETITDYLPNGVSETYTYVDLGIFYADKPSRTKTNIIKIDGRDGMSKFDVATEQMQITFPITLYELLNVVCEFVGVTHKVASFVNQGIIVDETVDIFQSTTARDVLGYIAETAGVNAKIDYDGELMFSWWSDTDLVINESDYSSFVPYEYTVKPIDKLQIRNSESDIGVLIGDGTNGYIIQENPFLTFSSNAEGQVEAEPIYDRLRSFSEYTPGNVEWFGDWSYRPGDVITVQQEGTSYRYPIFGYTLNWSRTAIITLNSTGNEYRDVLDVKSREEYVVGRKMLEITKNIDGVKIIASEAKTTSEGALEKVSEFSQTIEGFNTRVSTVESGQDNLESQINQTAEKIEAKVSKGEVISAINLTPEQAKIQSKSISLEGIVTANNKFKVLLDGSIEATDGKFAGNLSSGNWSFNQSGAAYNNGSQGINMTIMSGDFVGGGSDTRAFFGSSGLDVQYGSDYNKTTYIRSGEVVVIAQNPEQMSEYATAKFIRTKSDLGHLTFVCGESKGNANPNTNPSNGSSGNLGFSDQYWDYTFTRVLRAETYPGSSSRKIKQDIEELPDMGDAIDSLVPVSFAYKNDPLKKRYGLIYEDTMNVMPVVCFDDGKGDPGIVYIDLIAPLLKEIQSLRKRVKDLEERM